MKNRTRIMLTVFVAIIVSFVIFSVLASFHSHDCVGGDCALCHLIDNVRRILGMGAILSLFFARIDLACFVNKAVGVHNERRMTLVTERVKITS